MQKRVWCCQFCRSGWKYNWLLQNIRKICRSTVCWVWKGIRLLLGWRESWLKVVCWAMRRRRRKKRDLVFSNLSLSSEFLDATSPRIYPWNQSKISFRKSSIPRIYPWNQSQISFRKSSIPRIYPWNQSQISFRKSKIDWRLGTSYQRCAQISPAAK